MAKTVEPSDDIGYIFPTDSTARSKHWSAPSYSGTVSVEGKDYIMKGWKEKKGRIAVKFAPLHPHL